MQNMNSSNMWQAKEAKKAINAIRKARGLPSLEEVGKKAHTFTPKGGARDARREEIKVEVEECRYCRQTGHTIKKKGVLTCPKLIAKEKSKDAYRNMARLRADRVKDDWCRHIDDISGNAVEEWTRVKTRTNDTKKSASPKKVRKIRNRYDMGESDDEEEEKKWDTVKPCKPKKIVGVWGVGATAAMMEPEPDAPGPAKLERQVATSSWYDSLDEEIPNHMIPEKPKLVRGGHVDGDFTFPNEAVANNIEYGDMPELIEVGLWGDMTE